MCVCVLTLNDLSSLSYLPTYLCSRISIECCRELSVDVTLRTNLSQDLNETTETSFPRTMDVVPPTMH